MRSGILMTAGLALLAAGVARADGIRLQCVDTGGVQITLTGVTERLDGGLVLAGYAQGSLDTYVASLAPDGVPDWITRLSDGSELRRPISLAWLTSGDALVLLEGSVIVALGIAGDVSWTLLPTSGSLDGMASRSGVALAVGRTSGRPWFVRLDSSGVIDERLDEYGHPTLVAAMADGWVVAGALSGHPEPWSAVPVWRFDSAFSLIGSCYVPGTDAICPPGSPAGLSPSSYVAAEWLTAGPGLDAMLGLASHDSCGNLVAATAVGLGGDAAFEFDYAGQRTPTGQPAFLLQDGRSFHANAPGTVTLRGTGDEQLWSVAFDATLGPSVARRDGEGIIQSLHEGSSLVIARIGVVSALDAAGCSGARHALPPPRGPGGGCPNLSNCSGFDPIALAAHSSTWEPWPVAGMPECPGPACWSALPVEDCTQPGDEDGDGLEDCADDDCAASAACDVADSDGDGVADVDDCAPSDDTLSAVPDDPLLLVAKERWLEWSYADLSWSSVAGATHYDVVVLDPDSRTRISTESVDVMAWSGSMNGWFVVRAVNACGGLFGTRLLDP